MMIPGTFNHIVLPFTGCPVQIDGYWHVGVKDGFNVNHVYAAIPSPSKERAEEETQKLVNLGNLFHVYLGIDTLNELQLMDRLDIATKFASQILKERQEHKEFLDRLDSQLTVLGSKIENLREKILECKTPGLAKKLGRSIELRPDWDKVRLDVMEKLVRQKFTNPHLKKMLLKTSGYELIEGNWWNDQFWGVSRGKGKNHLGKILMKIRAELEQEE